MPFDPSTITAPFRMQPGLRRIVPGTAQLGAVRLGDGVLAAKLAVMRGHAAQALCAVEGWDAVPALAALCRQALLDAPEAWAATADGGWSALHLGWAVMGDHSVEGHGPAEIGACLRALPDEWRLAGLLCLAFAQDFAVIDGATAVIPWLAVCLPSHWAPQAKLGRHFAEVHAPVADNQVLLKAGQALAGLVSGTDRWERFVWTLTPQASLDAHPQRHPAPAWSVSGDADQLAAAAWLRTEHQTFIPVPERQQAVFTIHVEVRPLIDAVASGQAAALHAALASMSQAVLAYRGLASAQGRLLDWLAARDEHRVERGSTA